MKGDFTRSTFKPDKHYTSVRMQQGRVQLDADWNEQLDIQAHLDWATRRDLVGAAGTREDDDGFAISLSPQADASGAVPWLSKGHYYVGGVLCENEADGPLAEQPDYPGFSLPTEHGKYLAYLDVWQRHITALEDPSIREPALGGPDTSTRTKTVWQVKLLRVENDKEVGDFGGGWSPPDVDRTGRLRAWAQSDQVGSDDGGAGSSTDRCPRENQLYRVEVHRGSGTDENRTSPTFKWSRDNGSIAFRVEEIDEKTITVAEMGEGRLRDLRAGQWIELSNRTLALAGQPGVMVELAKIEGNKLTVMDEPRGEVCKPGEEAVARCWDSADVEPIASATQPAQIELEDGVHVQFEKEGRFRTGDYWQIPVRSASHDVQWPLDDDHQPVFRPAQGQQHRYAALALLELVNGAGWKFLGDCRRTFPALTDLVSVFYLGGDGQEVMPDAHEPRKLVPLTEPLRVGVANGRAPVPGASVEFEIVLGDGQLRDGVQSGKALVVQTDMDGVAECRWALGRSTDRTGRVLTDILEKPIVHVRQVKATLCDERGSALHLPVYFTASLSVAEQVAYAPPQVRPNPSARVSTVRDALDELHALYARKVDKAGDTMTGALHVQNDLTVMGDVQLGDHDGREVTIHGGIRSEHSSGAVEIADALHVTESLRVDAGVTARFFRGDGRRLTNLPTSKWRDADVRGIFYSGGNVGVGTPRPGADLDVAGELRLRKLSFSSDQGNTWKEAWVGVLEPGIQGVGGPELGFSGAIGTDGRTRVRLLADMVSVHASQRGREQSLRFSDACVISSRGLMSLSGDGPLHLFNRLGVAVRKGIRGNGNLHVEGRFSHGGRDFAEYFESASGRRLPLGTSVVLVNGKIRRAKKGEVPAGVTTATPAIVGGLHREWHEKYLSDEFGREVLEDHKEEIMAPKKEMVTRERQKVERKQITEEVTRTEVVLEDGKYCQREVTEKVTQEVEEPVFEEVDLYDAPGTKIVGKHRVPVMETYEEEIDVLDDRGEPVLVGTGKYVTEKRRRLNEDYDESLEYIPRDQRKEWHSVALVGQVPVRKGQPVADGWVKMKDISEKVALWLVK